MKAQFIRAISIGIKRDLSESKKLAIQIATLDSYWTLVVTTFYIFFSISRHNEPILITQISALLLTGVGIILIVKGYYDTARFLVHTVGLIQVFFSADATGVNSGAEFFYFTSIAIPFVTFDFEEQWKGLVQSLTASIFLVTQQLIGTGRFFPVGDFSTNDKIHAMLFVISYFVLVFSVVRWQVKRAQQQIEKQQDEIIQSSNMIALGEMSAGIAHEINNPLQSLSLQVSILKEGMDVDHPHYRQLNKMGETIHKIGHMVQDLKNMTKPTHEASETFHFNEILEDVISASNDKLKANGTKLFINGDSGHHIKGHSKQISKVLESLLNNSVEAVQHAPEKWIRIQMVEKSSFLQVCVTDSGERISQEVASKMMKPFFTTKNSNKGSGLGLSVSKNLIEKNNGSLFYDHNSPNTRFVILLPRQ